MSGRLAPWWSCHLIDHPLRRWLHPPRRLFGPYLQPGMRALDIGCGLGVFSLSMAKMVGPAGLVVAADVQQPSLDIVARRAARAGLAARVRTQLCPRDRLALDDEFDFVLASWMVHETPSPAALFTEVRAHLRPGGRMLVIEPRWHVRAAVFRDELAAAAAAGLAVVDEPRVFFSRAALLASRSA